MTTQNPTGERVREKFQTISALLFLAIFIVGCVAFFIAMRNITHANKGNELKHLLEIERVKLESSVNGEIDLVLRMSGSPLIHKHFMHPNDKKLEQEALEEIAAFRRTSVGRTLFWVNDTDKKFYFDSTYSYTIDPEDPNDYWYKMTLYETKKYNFNINYNPNLNVLNLWINAPIFDGKRIMDREPKPIGMFGAGVDLTAFIDSIYKKYHGAADLYFFNKLGEITGAADAALVKDKTPINKHLGSLGTKINNRAKNIFTDKMQYFIYKDRVVAVGMVPTLGWYVTAVQPFGAKDYLNANAISTFLSILLVIALIFVIFNIMVNRLLKKHKIK